MGPSRGCAIRAGQLIPSPQAHMHADLGNLTAKHTGSSNIRRHVVICRSLSNYKATASESSI
jgi:hypothetical protein